MAMVSFNLEMWSLLWVKSSLSLTLPRALCLCVCVCIAARWISAQTPNQFCGHRHFVCAMYLSFVFFPLILSIVFLAYHIYLVNSNERLCAFCLLLPLPFILARAPSERISWFAEDDICIGYLLNGCLVICANTDMESSVDVFVCQIRDM